MNENQKLSELRPLFYGRLSRVIFGLAAFALILYVGPDDLGTWGLVGLVFLGVSFIIGGIMANPGCELTALPNLVLPREEHVHFT